jgi:hypothetical protein
MTVAARRLGAAAAAAGGRALTGSISFPDLG